MYCQREEAGACKDAPEVAGLGEGAAWGALAAGKELHGGAPPARQHGRGRARTRCRPRSSCWFESPPAGKDASCCCRLKKRRIRTSAGQRIGAAAQISSFLPSLCRALALSFRTGAPALSSCARLDWIAKRLPGVARRRPDAKQGKADAQAVKADALRLSVLATPTPGNFDRPDA